MEILPIIITSSITLAGVAITALSAIYLFNKGKEKEIQFKRQELLEEFISTFIGATVGKCSVAKNKFNTEMQGYLYLNFSKQTVELYEKFIISLNEKGNDEVNTDLNSSKEFLEFINHSRSECGWSDKYKLNNLLITSLT